MYSLVGILAKVAVREPQQRNIIFSHTQSCGSIDCLPRPPRPHLSGLDETAMGGGAVRKKNNTDPGPRRPFVMYQSAAAQHLVIGMRRQHHQ